MDETRFDTLTKRLTRMPSRRQVVKGLGGGLVAALGAAVPPSPVAAGCRGEGAACKKDGQCCSGLCVPPIVSTSTGRAGVSNVCGAPVVVCTPTGAACEGKNCGDVVDDCGETVSCGGPCTQPETCGGGGVNNVCGVPACAPNNAAACEGKNCGDVTNNCGETVNCGTCTGSATCGGGGVNNVCGTPPVVCLPSGAACDINDPATCCGKICQADDYNGVSCPGDIPFCCL